MPRQSIGGTNPMNNQVFLQPTNNTPNGTSGGEIETPASYEGVALIVSPLSICFHLVEEILVTGVVWKRDIVKGPCLVLVIE
jgi:hypothetical protein